MRRAGRWLAVLACVGAAACGGAQSGGDAHPRGRAVANDGPWTIRIERPARVGQSFDLRGEGTSRTVTDAGGQRETRETRVRYSAVETVRAVTPRGKEMDLELEIMGFEAQGEEGHAPFSLRQGQRVFIHRAAAEAQSTVLVDGQPASAQARAAVANAFELTVDDSSPSDDAVLGTNVPQAVGGRWAVNGELGSRELERRTGMQLTLTGEFRLEGRLRVGPVECLSLAGVMRSPLRSMPSLPAGATLTSATMEAEFGGAFPLDPALPQLRDSQRLTVDATLSVPSRAGAVTVHVVSDNVRSSERTPR